MSTGPFPPYLVGLDASTIYAGMAAKVRAAGYPLPDDSAEGILLHAFAEQLFDIGVVQTQRLYSALFIGTQVGEELDESGKRYGLPRLAATFATVSVTLEGPEDTVIPVDTVLTTAATTGTAAVRFRVLAEATIDDTESVEVETEALEAGANGNVGIGTVRFLASPIAGITNVHNDAAGIGGSDVEADGAINTTEAYRGRLLERAAEDPGMANIDDYERLVDEIPGVGFRRVDPLWDGYGSVRIVILDEDGEIPDEDLVDLVQETLDPIATPGEGQGEASIAHVVTVVGPDALDLEMAIPNVVPEPGTTLSAAKAAGEAAVLALAATINPGGLVILRDFEAVYIQAAGVKNIGDATLDGARADVQLTPIQKVVLTFSYP